MINTRVPMHTLTLRETSCKHYFISSVFVRKSEGYNPDFLLGERSFRSILCVIGKVNGKQATRQWEFCYHAVNSFVTILDAMLTRMTCMASY